MGCNCWGMVAGSYGREDCTEAEGGRWFVGQSRQAPVAGLESNGVRGVDMDIIVR